MALILGKKPGVWPKSMNSPNYWRQMVKNMKANVFLSHSTKWSNAHVHSRLMSSSVFKWRQHKQKQRYKEKVVDNIHSALYNPSHLATLIRVAQLEKEEKRSWKVDITREHPTGLSSTSVCYLMPYFTNIGLCENDGRSYRLGSNGRTALVDYFVANLEKMPRDIQDIIRGKLDDISDPHNERR